MGLNVAVIRRECGFSMGGAERYCAGVVRGLAQRGHRVTVIADSMEPSVRETAGTGVKFLRAPMSGRGSLMKNMSFFMSVQQVLSGEEFDLTYGLSRIMPADVLRISDPLHAAWLELGYSRGFFSLFRRFMPRHSSILSMERKAIAAAGLVVTNSRLTAEHVMHYYGVSSEKITTIHNGYDPVRFYPVQQDKKHGLRVKLGLPSDRNIILFAGTNLERKGLGTLIDALGSMAGERDFRLIVAGPESLGPYGAKAEKADIADRIIMPGYVRDMAAMYQASDLFVLPTRYDPFANSCLEAAACGVPVITTAFNGAGEVISAAAPWLVVENAAPEPLAHALKHFFSLSVEDRYSLGDSMVSAAAGYTWEHHMDRLMEVFMRISGRT